MPTERLAAIASLNSVLTQRVPPRGDAGISRLIRSQRCAVRPAALDREPGAADRRLVDLEVLGALHSKYPRPLLRPALHHHLLLRVEVDRVAPLRVEVAEEAVLPAAEREVGDGGGDADVDADVADAGLVAELPGRGAAAGEEAGLVAEARAVHCLDGLVHVGDVDEAQDRSEDLGGRGLAARIHVREDGRADEVALLVPFDPRAARVHRELRAFLDTLLDERLDARFRFGADHRAHLHALVEAVPDLPRLLRRGDRLGELAPGIADRDGNGGSE